MADLLSNPQFEVPFRVAGGEVKCVEQDTSVERIQNAIVILRYRPGDREGLPAFGTPDPAFNEGGADLEQIAARIQRWEPDLEFDELTQTIGENGENLVEISFVEEAGR